MENTYDSFVIEDFVENKVFDKTKQKNSSIKINIGKKIKR